jgi:acyl carrier protein
LDHDALYQTMLGIIADQLALNPASLRETTNLLNDLDVDSLDMLQIIISIEDEFNITVPESDFGHMVTIGDAVRDVERLLS